MKIDGKYVRDEGRSAAQHSKEKHPVRSLGVVSKERRVGEGCRVRDERLGKYRPVCRHVSREGIVRFELFSDGLISTSSCGIVHIRAVRVDSKLVYLTETSCFLHRCRGIVGIKVEDGINDGKMDSIA